MLRSCVADEDGKGPTPSPLRGEEEWKRQMGLDIGSHVLHIPETISSFYLLPLNEHLIGT